MSTICAKCEHYPGLNYLVISEMCRLPTKKTISFVSGNTLCEYTECREKNKGKCPDFTPKPEPRKLATVVIWVGVKIPEPVEPVEPDKFTSWVVFGWYGGIFLWSALVLLTIGFGVLSLGGAQ